MIFLFKQVIFRFHVSFRGCSWMFLPTSMASRGNWPELRSRSQFLRTSEWQALDWIVFLKRLVISDGRRYGEGNAISCSWLNKPLKGLSVGFRALGFAGFAARFRHCYWRADMPLWKWKPLKIQYEAWGWYTTARGLAPSAPRPFLGSRRTENFQKAKNQNSHFLTIK